MFAAKVLGLAGTGEGWNTRRFVRLSFWLELSFQFDFS